MHTHIQSGFLSQNRPTSGSGRHYYIKVCGPKKAEGTVVWNGLHIVLIHTEQIGKLTRSDPGPEEVIMPNSWTHSYKFINAKSFISFTTCEFKKAMLLVVLEFKRNLL